MLQSPKTRRCIPHNKIAIAILACVLIGEAGCQNVLWRGQDADEKSGILSNSTETKTEYIGDITAVWGMNFAKIEGIALVTQLKGTGSNPPPSSQRDQLIKDMQAHHVQNAAEVLASDSTSMVIVAANLPPGVRKGDRFDVYVETMPNSETTSLRDGFVMQTWMRPMAVLNHNVERGRDMAQVKGRIQVRAMFEPGDNPMLARSGYVLGGGVSEVDRTIGLAIRDESAPVRIARKIEWEINQRFPMVGPNKAVGVAKAKNNVSIELLVPEEYRQNVGRYISVVNSIALTKSAQERIDLMEQLEKELQESALARQAALRLEAIGKDAIPVFRRALQSDDAEVRFCAAEALTYLDQPDGIEILKAAAERDPDFRWHGLTALASSEHLKAGIALTDLFHSENAETRYGAFRAMFARSPKDPMMKGHWMLGEFYLHVVPTTGPSMVHFSTQKRPEIVIFGGGGPVSDNFLYIENGLTIQAKGNDQVELVRYLAGKGESKLKCRNSVADVICMMADAGCTYESLLAMCKEAQTKDTLQCRVMINRVPTSDRMYSRGTSVATDEPNTNDEPNANDQPVDKGDRGVPSMFADAPVSSPFDAQLPPEVEASNPPKKGVFGTIKSWFTGR